MWWRECSRCFWRICLYFALKQCFYRPVHPSRAWIVFCSWSYTYETKSGKTKSLKVKAGQAKLTHGIVQIIWTFTFIHITVRQRTENSLRFTGSILQCDCLLLQRLCFVQTYSCFITTADRAHLTVQSSYTSPRAGNPSTWFYYTSLSVSH